MEGEDSGYNLAVAAAADMASGHQMTPQTDADHWQGDSTDGAGLDSAPAAEPSFAPSAVETAEPNGSEPEAGEDSPDLAMWLRAYRTGGPATRRHAARQLERLTGKHYEC
jgi:hypothetical protein